MEPINNQPLEVLNMSDQAQYSELATKRNIYLLIGALTLGLLFNHLFYEKPLGLSYPLYVMAL